VGVDHEEISFSRSAMRKQSASIVRVGFDRALVGKTALLPTYKLAIPCTLPGTRGGQRDPTAMRESTAIGHPIQIGR
jgi:hypothetical protein